MKSRNKPKIDATVEVSAVSYEWNDPVERQLAIALVEAKVLSEGHLRALGATKQREQSLLDAVISSGLVSEEEVSQALAGRYGLPYVRLASVPIDSSLFRFIPHDKASQHHCVPIKLEGEQLTVAMYNPLDLTLVDALEFEQNLKVKVVLATRRDILNAISTQYGLVDTLQTFMSGICEQEDGEVEVPSSARATHDLDEVVTEESKPIIKLSNMILSNGVGARASDIHIEPMANMVKIRYRVDGVIQTHSSLPKWVQNALVSRFKVIARLNIASRQTPQDGRLNLKYNDRTIDLRVSTLPTHYGEKVVIRILDPGRSVSSIDNLGLSGRNLQVIRTALDSPQGMLLTTGPTGSGKTSTLYAAVHSLRTEDKNIVTVEDPVEMQIPGVNQVQVNERAKLTFANALRSILRQDPDVVLIGEIRDTETAAVAFQAAQTGHLVLSSLHTNDAVATLSRLAELEVEPYLIAESTLAVMAQRLARRNCSECSEPYAPSPEELRRLGLAQGEGEIRRGNGCELCQGSGFMGRIGLFEVLAMETALADLIIKGADSSDVRAAAARAGMKSILDDAVQKVLQGLTTPEEVLRVIQLDEEYEFRCPECGRPGDPNLAVCPSCSHERFLKCPACGMDLNSKWTCCPFCRASVDSGPTPLRPSSPVPPDAQQSPGPDEPPPAAREPAKEKAIPVEEPVPSGLEPATEGREPLGPATDEGVPGSAFPQAELSSPVAADAGDEQRQANAGPHSTFEMPKGILDGEGPLGELPGQLEDILIPDGRFRILIADDDIVTCNLITLLFRRFKFKNHVVVTMNGREALERVREETPHLIILDLLMPEVDGYELLAQLRGDLKTAFIPVIVMTQTSPEKTRSHSLKLGADEYLNKPVDPARLESCVTSILNRIYGI